MNIKTFLKNKEAPILTVEHKMVQRKKDIGNHQYKFMKNVTGTYVGWLRKDKLWDVTYIYNTSYIAN